MREMGPSRVADTGDKAKGQGESRESEHALIGATIGMNLESLC